MPYYLIKNENGFESIVREGPMSVVKKEMDQLEKNAKQNDDPIKYYMIKKEDWTPECPLIPVDLS